MNENMGPTESTNLVFCLKPMWQDLWRGRARIVLLLSTSLALLVWSGPSARVYDLLFTLLIVVTTVFPLVCLIWALIKSDRFRSDNDLLEAGMFRVDRLDDRNVVPLALLTLVMIAAGTALAQSPALRATLEFPLPLAPGRWLVATSTSAGITMLCHTCYTGLGL